MDFELDQRVVVVTGGGSGIGRACVDALAAQGARVGILDRAPDAEPLSSTADVFSVHTDVTIESEVERAIEAVVERYGQLDAVIGCAGISGPVGTRLAHVQVDDWDRVMAVNVRGNFLVAKQAMPHLERSAAASIVFLASDSAFVAFDGMGPYTASKGAVVALAKAFAVDHPTVRANALCPGIVDTPMSRADLGRPDGFEGSGLPVMQAAQLARQALFLVSPVSAPMTGTTLISDFGFLARSALGALDFSQG